MRASPALPGPSHSWVLLHMGYGCTLGSGWDGRGFLDTHWGQTLHRMKNDLLEIFKNYLSEYYSPMKRIRLLILAAIRMNLRDMNVSERSQPQISTCCLFTYVKF